MSCIRDTCYSITDSKVVKSQPPYHYKGCVIKHYMICHFDFYLKMIKNQTSLIIAFKVTTNAYISITVILYNNWTIKIFLRIADLIYFKIFLIIKTTSHFIPNRMVWHCLCVGKSRQYPREANRIPWLYTDNSSCSRIVPHQSPLLTRKVKR